MARITLKAPFGVCERYGECRGPAECPDFKAINRYFYGNMLHSFTDTLDITSHTMAISAYHLDDPSVKAGVYTIRRETPKAGDKSHGCETMITLHGIDPDDGFVDEVRDMAERLTGKRFTKRKDPDVKRPYHDTEDAE
jgi:hypothetical protein